MRDGASDRGGAVPILSLYNNNNITIINIIIVIII